MKFCSFLIIFCVFVSQSVNAMIVFDFLKSVFGGSRNTPLLFLRYRIDFYLQPESVEPFEDKLTTFYYACPKLLCPGSQTNNCFFMSKLENFEESPPKCISEVTPSMISKKKGDSNNFSTGFEIYFGEDHKFANTKENNYEMNPNYRWFPILDINFTKELKSTNYVLTPMAAFNSVQSTSSENQQFLDESSKKLYSQEMTLGKQLLYENIDIQKLYSLSNQEKIFTKIFPNADERQRFYNPKNDDNLEMQFLVQPTEFTSNNYKKATLTYANVAAMWKKIKYGNWRNLLELIHSLSTLEDNSALMKLIGVHDVLTLKQSVYLTPDNKIPVPKLFWVFLRLVTVNAPKSNIQETRYHELFIITHNNPYETPTQLECTRNICQEYGWDLINDTNNSENGITYCCPAEEKILKTFNLDINMSLESDSTPREILHFNKLNRNIEIEEEDESVEDIDITDKSQKAD